MMAFGMLGFFAGIIFRCGLIKVTKLSLAAFGILSGLVIYGGIINPASVLMWQDYPTLKMVAASFVTGLPFDIIHSVSTGIFMWFMAEPIIEKFERVKRKYGI